MKKKCGLRTIYCADRIIIAYISQEISDFEDHFLSLFPAEARIGYGLAIDMFVDLLRAVFDVALYHETFDKIADIAVIAAV